MVEVAYSSDVAQLCGKSVAHCGSGGFRLGAKTSLQFPTSSCQMSVGAADGGGSVAELDMSEQERIPPSPRRQLLRTLIQCRGERKAVREQRSLEIEHELLVQLGLDTETASPASGSRSVAAHGTVSSSGGTTGRSDCEGSSTAEGATSTGQPTRAPSRSCDRPHSTRRGLACSSSGPPRPPKPKPHRPLNLSDDSAPAGAALGASAQALPEERRWKSALLPYWPDRQGIIQGVEPAGADLVAETSDQPRLDEKCTTDISADAPASALSVDLLQTETSPGSATTSLALSAAERCECVPQQAQEPACAAALATSSAIPGADEAVVTASAAATSRSMKDSEHKRLAQEEGHLAERKLQLEASAKRLRDNVQRLRFENRRGRVLGACTASGTVPSDSSAVPLATPLDDVQSVSKRLADFSAAVALSANVEISAAELSLDHSCISTMQGAVGSPSTLSAEEVRRLQEMRHKIAELDRINELERQRLEEEQREVRERRQQQEAFEREVQERTVRDIEQHRAREAQAEAERAAREEEQQRELVERGRRRKEQLQQEEECSKRLETQRREGRSAESQLKWHRFEEELDKHWDEQEAEERRRIDQYAKDRQRWHDDSDRRFASERQKFANAADSVHAARRLQQARSSADADQRFYGPQRFRGPAANVPPPSRPPSAQLPKPALPLSSSAPALNAEECSVLKELQSVRGFSRDSQKAKVKELLFRWHPDKNPACVEKATRIFQFVQRQREVVLGL